MPGLLLRLHVFASPRFPNKSPASLVARPDRNLSRMELATLARAFFCSPAYWQYFGGGYHRHGNALGTSLEGTISDFWCSSGAGSVLRGNTVLRYGDSCNCVGFLCCNGLAEWGCSVLAGGATCFWW